MSISTKKEARNVMQNAARMYFAPLVGAIDAVRKEVRRVNNGSANARILKPVKSSNEEHVMLANGNMQPLTTILSTYAASDSGSVRVVIGQGVRIRTLDSRSPSTSAHAFIDKSIYRDMKPQI